MSEMLLNNRRQEKPCSNKQDLQALAPSRKEPLAFRSYTTPEGEKFKIQRSPINLYEDGFKIESNGLDGQTKTYNYDAQGNPITKGQNYDEKEANEALKRASDPRNIETTKHDQEVFKLKNLQRQFVDPNMSPELKKLQENGIELLINGEDLLGDKKAHVEKDLNDRLKSFYEDSLNNSNTKEDRAKIREEMSKRGLTAEVREDGSFAVIDKKLDPEAWKALLGTLREKYGQDKRTPYSEAEGFGPPEVRFPLGKYSR